MSIDDENQTQSPFTRPGFIAAAIVIALIVVLGIVIGIANVVRDDNTETEPSPAPATTTTAPTAEPSEVAGGTSVCGLEGVVAETARLSTAPDAEWEYQGTTAYPTSPTYGPGATEDNGVRYCFQHSPEGALFMAANAIAQGSDPSVGPEWVDYALAEGPYREELLSDMGSATDTEGTRLAIAGFRLLHYDGETARVDLAVRGSAEGQTITLSGIYELVWQDGDWKISADVAQPLDMGTIPDVTGYIPWGE